MMSLVYVLKHCCNGWVASLVDLRHIQWHLHDMSGYNTSGKLPAENMFDLLFSFTLCFVLDNLRSKRLYCFVSGDKGMWIHLNVVLPY